MELEHAFTVPVRRERAWDLLLDVQRVAPCMPGATLDSVDGDVIKGRIKVKVGPISMTYAGTARFTEKDADAFVMVLEASGKETRGAGTAAAKVRSVLADEGDQTKVTVSTTLNVTGRPAQFGRGVLADVSGRLIGMFAANLAAMITEQGAGPGTEANGTTAGPGGGADAAGRRREANGAEVAGRSGGTNGAAADSGAGTDRTAAGAPGRAGAVDGNPDGGLATSAAAEDSASHAVAGDGDGPAAAAGLDVADLGLSARTAGRLRGAGLLTAGAIAARTEQELLAIDGIGPTTVREIQASLAGRGLALGRSAGADAAAPPSRPDPAGPPADAVRAGGDEALNLLKVAGPPVLKRVLPALAGLVTAALIALRLRRWARRGR